jgi:plastocyanin
VSWAATAAAVAGLAFAAAGCAGGPDPDAAEPVRTTEVRLPKSYRFDPVAIEVDAGSEVTWTNDDSFTHTVKLEDGPETSDHRVDRGASITLRFDTAGTYHYVCTLHPRDMKGVVVVR